MVGGSGQWMSTVVKSTGLPYQMTGAIQWDMRRLGTGGAGDVIAGNGFWSKGERIHYCE